MKLAELGIRKIGKVVRFGPVLALLALWTLAPRASAVAQDDVGSLAGVEQGSAIVVAIGDGFGLPGEDAAVPVTMSNSEGDVFQVSMDFFYPVPDLSVEEQDCTIDPRLAATHSLSVFFPDNCGQPEGEACLRFIVTSLQRRVFGDGGLLTCNFNIASEVQLGAVLDLIADAESLQVINPSTPPIVLEAVAEDGSVTVAEQPTPTATPTGTPVVDITATPTEGGGETPTPTVSAVVGTPTATTTGVVGTATPTIIGGTATATRTGGVGTATATHTPGGVVGTATATPATAVPTPTRTRTGGVTPPKTNTPGTNGLDDDSCAISPASQQQHPFRSLLLLIAPAMLLAGRRRRR